MSSQPNLQSRHVRAARRRRPQEHSNYRLKKWFLRRSKMWSRSISRRTEAPRKVHFRGEEKLKQNKTVREKTMTSKSVSDNRNTKVSETACYIAKQLYGMKGSQSRLQLHCMLLLCLRHFCCNVATKLSL